jgi:hypothetical protein
MFAQKDDKVILISTEQPQLKKYVGSEWLVRAVIHEYHPASAIIVKDNLQASVYLKNLEVIPPEESPFEHNEAVKIIKTYQKTSVYTCKPHLVNEAGHIKGFDSRNQYYFIRCLNGEIGWFPATCLAPLDYRGERFFYPGDTVRYKNKNCVINKVKKSKFKWGQLLFINGSWVPSTDVKAIEKS